MDTTLFAQPQQDPAISGNQQAAQTSTYDIRKSLAGNSDPTGIEYDAYKLSQQALGMKPLTRGNWQMMYRHSMLMDSLDPLRINR